jgi:hypothetical protein
MAEDETPEVAVKSTVLPLQTPVTLAAAEGVGAETSDETVSTVLAALQQPFAAKTLA